MNNNQTNKYTYVAQTKNVIAQTNAHVLDLWWRLQFDWKRKTWEIFDPKSFLSESVKRRAGYQQGGGVGDWLQPSQRMWKKVGQDWAVKNIEWNVIDRVLESPALKVCAVSREWKLIENFAQNMFFPIPVPILIEIPQRQRTDPICDSINTEMGCETNVERSANQSLLWIKYCREKPVSRRSFVFILKYKLEREIWRCLFICEREGSRRRLKARE